MTEQLLTPTQAAATLAMTKGALAQLRYLDTGPRYVKVSGRSVRYRPQDLDAWIRANIHGRNGAGDQGVADLPDSSQQPRSTDRTRNDTVATARSVSETREPAISARA